MGLECDVGVWHREDDSHELKSFATHLDLKIELRPFLDSGLVALQYVQPNTLSKRIRASRSTLVDLKERDHSV